MSDTFNESTGNLLKAIHFSAFKHRDQRRKDQSRSPYINHPITLAETLWTIGGVRDEATLIAAILHDTIEDTETTPDEIREKFGEEVLSLVLEVTDDKSLPKATRKRLQIEHAAHISPKAKLIKLADKISNLNDLLYSPPHSWTFTRKQKYLLWTKQVIDGLRGANSALENRYDELLATGKRILELELASPPKETS
ncbi:MAG: HD domain-containing protein [Chloroflexi bacterium]|nr:HD domain-containing protein [Chloroflexota bacterium]